MAQIGDYAAETGWAPIGIGAFTLLGLVAGWVGRYIKKHHDSAASLLLQILLAIAAIGLITMGVGLLRGVQGLFWGGFIAGAAALGLGGGIGFMSRS